MFSEIGFHPCGFVTTEVEGYGGEVRLRGFITGRIVSAYARIRMFGYEVVLDSSEGLKAKAHKRGFRAVLGVRSI